MKRIVVFALLGVIAHQLVAIAGVDAGTPSDLTNALMSSYASNSDASSVRS